MNVELYQELSDFYNKLENVYRDRLDDTEAYEAFDSPIIKILEELTDDEYIILSNWFLLEGLQKETKPLIEKVLKLMEDEKWQARK